VASVEGTMEMSRLVVEGPVGEVLIPLVADICVNVDVVAKRITVELPEGLVDLNGTRRERGRR
jgi:ribosomal 30S subunit maturation factor RimM